MRTLYGTIFAAAVGVAISTAAGAERNIAFRFADHAFRLEKGDILRVDISSANSQFAPHPNVSGDAFACSSPKVAHNTVYPERSFLKLLAIGGKSKGPL